MNGVYLTKTLGLTNYRQSAHLNTSKALIFSKDSAGSSTLPSAVHGNTATATVPGLLWICFGFFLTQRVLAITEG